MKQISSARFPRKRLQKLVVDELPDEVLVYDLDRHKAHCLNQTAALVWNACDGRSDPAAIAQRLTKKSLAPFSEEVVWLALRQLEEINLLEKKIAVPAQFAGISRRKMMRNLGLAAAVAVPVITSIVAPTAAEASTCVQSGSPCSSTIACCSVLGCDTVNNVCH